MIQHCCQKLSAVEGWPGLAFAVRARSPGQLSSSVRRCCKTSTHSPPALPGRTRCSVPCKMEKLGRGNYH